MKPEKEVKFFKLLRGLNRQRIRYLIIGRRAVILYGGPVLTADNNIWLHPKIRRRLYYFSRRNSISNFPILLTQRDPLLRGSQR